MENLFILNKNKFWETRIKNMVKIKWLLHKVIWIVANLKFATENFKFFGSKLIIS